MLSTPHNRFRGNLTLAFFALFLALQLIPFRLAASPNPSPNCDPEAADHSTVVLQYRHDYVPKEYLPEPRFMSYLDVAVLAGFLILGLACLFRPSCIPRKHLWLVPMAALGYFGLFRGGCVCPVGAVVNVALGVAHPELVGTAVALLFLLPLIAALIGGRIFCSYGCPIGAMQTLFVRKRFLRLPRWLTRLGALSAFSILVATVYMALSEKEFLVCDLDMYKVVFHTGYSWVSRLMAKIHGYPVESFPVFAGIWLAWIGLAVALIVGYWIPRPFCRFICPYGALLGIISKVALRRRTIVRDSCGGCGACVQVCRVQAIREVDGIMVASPSTCMQCGACVVACHSNAIAGLSCKCEGEKRSDEGKKR